MFSLAGRVALITGAASGIGAATARIFAEAGADLALAWYPPDGHDIEPVRKAVEKAGRRVVVAEVDVTRTTDVDALVARAVKDLGGMHIVVANAGIARKVELADLDDAAWNKVVDVDLNGVWRCFRAALPHMQRAGFGRLLATSSVAGTVSAWPLHAHYTAAKAGLVGLDHDPGGGARSKRHHGQCDRARCHPHAAGPGSGEFAAGLQGWRRWPGKFPPGGSARPRISPMSSSSLPARKQPT